MTNVFDAITLGCEYAASTSSSEKPSYDVFINHCGKDVKHTLATSIYKKFRSMRVQVFLDQPALEVGDSFPRGIEEAMRRASIHIAIFSPSYAESPWCLEELSFMEHEVKSTIIPVFYGVDPSDLRYVAKGRYGDAFVQHRRKGRFALQKIEEWKKALRRVSYVKGYIVDPAKCDEGKLSSKIVDLVLYKMKKMSLKVDKFSVGLVEAVQDFRSKVVSTTGKANVNIVGISGSGGSGKTTLAKELFNRKYKKLYNTECSFRSSFLFNIRHAALEKDGLLNLQKILLKDLGIQHSEFHHIHQGKEFLAKGLKSKKVLIVLDDVDDVDQLDAMLLPEDNLGQGSFILVTTRAQDVLTSWGISSIYNMKLLDPFKAKQLFCRHAGLELRNDHYFEGLINRFVEACNGLPLILKVYGAMVNGKPKSYWESQLLKISKIFPGEGVVGYLEISYKALDWEKQQLFLDIASFFVGKKKNQVMAVWDRWSEVGLQTLIIKCFVALNNGGCIEMHDHLQDLGRRFALSPCQQSDRMSWLVKGRR